MITVRTCPNQVRTVITYIETVMRWIYKTVHFELKKEGLLGSPFLDRSEIELSLNEYGRAGWVLISTTEVSDGILAIFKQPLRQTRKKKEPTAQLGGAFCRPEIGFPRPMGPIGPNGF